MSNRAVVIYQLLSPFTPTPGGVTVLPDTAVQVSLGPNSPPWITLQGGATKTVVINGSAHQLFDVKLLITLNNANGNPLYPCGIAIKGGPTDPRAQGTFPTFKIRGNACELTDDDLSDGLFSFKLMFQDAQGNTGILDPRIQNT